MTNKLSAVIVEDEKPAARRLERILLQLEVDIHAVLHSVEEATYWFLQNEHPQLIFLDIQLSDGLSFEIFDNVEISSHVIFTTAFDQYALQAFKLNSVDYLLKPIDTEEVSVAVEKFNKNLQLKEKSIDFLNLQSLLNLSGPRYKKRFCIPVGQHIKLIPITEISCFYSSNKSSYICSTSGRTFPVEMSLDQLEAEINPEQFFRVNRKFIISLSDIADIVSYSSSRLAVKLKAYDAEQIIVSRERVRAFKNWIG